MLILRDSYTHLFDSKCLCYDIDIKRTFLKFIQRYRYDIDVNNDVLVVNLYIMNYFILPTLFYTKSLFFNRYGPRWHGSSRCIRTSGN